MSDYSTLFAAEPEPPTQKRKLIGDYQEGGDVLTRDEATELRAERLRVRHYQKCGGGYRVFRKRLHPDE